MYEQETEEENINGARYLKSSIKTTQPTPAEGEWFQVREIRSSEVK